MCSKKSTETIRTKIDFLQKQKKQKIYSVLENRPKLISLFVKKVYKKIRVCKSTLKIRAKGNPKRSLIYGGIIVDNNSTFGRYYLVIYLLLIYLIYFFFR